ncbi:hypothetical protein GC194_06665 [bacterium]|nr:hypothetical protein [bacterium]
MRYLSLASFLFTSTVLFFSCGKEADPWDGFAPFTATYNPSQLEKTSSFASQAQVVGPVDYAREASGLAVSKANENAIWTHNDSGNPEFIFLMDKNTGKLKASYRIKGLTNTDWEDIEVGPGPVKGNSYIYLGDIGDNSTSRPEVFVYRFQEPLYADAHAGKTIELAPEVDKIRMSYPDTKQNSETLLLDPITLDVYIVSKFGVSSKLYVAKYPQLLSDVNVLEVAGTFPFRVATGGDVSANGCEIFIKTYDNIFYWQCSEKDWQPVWKLLSTTPLEAPYNPVESQGEAICVEDGGYYTLSEQKANETQELYFYKRQ